MRSALRFVLVVLVLWGCSHGVAARGAESAAAGAPSPSAPPPSAAEPPSEMLAALAAEESEASPAPVMAPAAAPAAPGAGAPVVPAVPGVPGVVAQTASSTDAARVRMLDIEARLTLQVESVTRAAAELRRLTVANGGDVVEESVQDAAAAARAQLTLRVPSPAADDLLQKIEAVGSVTSRQVTARDVGKQYYDATLRLENLGWALARFEQILARANSVDEILRVEQEIARVRGQIEQIKGELRYLRDRTSRATIHVALLGPEMVAPPPVVSPKAKFYPGLRLTYLGDLWREGQSDGFAGGGVSVRFSRHFSVDLDGLRGSTGSDGGLDVFLATLGGELYSDFLGAGRRKWLNPYLGLRGGYARLRGRNEIAAGGSVGVELLQTKVLTLELDARFYGLFGTSAGAHLAVQPALGANVAF